MEVTKRTIYRDMAALQAMRLPIEGEAGVGYVMRSGFDLPPLMFNQDELEAIIVGLALLGRMGDKSLERSAENAARKISDVLPEETPPVAPLRVSRWNRIPESGVEMGALRWFIRDNAELEITYINLKDQRSTRLIKPLAMIYYIDAVLLAAWCETRQGFRHFRIDRIEHCAPTGQHFGEISERLVMQWERESELP